MTEYQLEEIEAAECAGSEIVTVVVPEDDDREQRIREEIERYVEEFKLMSEEDFSNIEFYKEPRPRTAEDLGRIIDSLVERDHDYGTAVYAMSLAAMSAYNYVAHKLGVTGFQAGCADLDFIRRSRHLEHGFMILNYNNLLYPQYYNNPDRFPTAHQLLMKNKEHLAETARRLLNEGDREHVHSNVWKHWEWIASLDGGE